MADSGDCKSAPTLWNHCSRTGLNILTGICDANDAVQLTLIKPGDNKPATAEIFHPQFTYPIFGDDEQIFGYKGLIIRLRFATHDLRTHVHISYDEKFRAVGDAAAVDLNKTLREWIPECMCLLKFSDPRNPS